MKILIHIYIYIYICDSIIIMIINKHVCHNIIGCIVCIVLSKHIITTMMVMIMMNLI